jgi:hypothetical protein
MPGRRIVASFLLHEEFYFKNILSGRNDGAEGQTDEITTY